MSSVTPSAQLGCCVSVVMLTRTAAARSGRVARACSVINTNQMFAFYERICYDLIAII